MSDSGKNKAAIGAFVVGAVALAVVGIIVFGGGKMFDKKTYFVMYFDGSVKGLNIGAPVSFRGVKIGSVTDVTVHANTETLEFRIPVVVEIEGDKIEKTAAWSQPAEQGIKALIDAGLRARRPRLRNYPKANNSSCFSTRTARLSVIVLPDKSAPVL